MALVLQDCYRILTHLSMPMSRLEEIQTQVEQVNRSEFLSQMVLGILSDLDELDKDIAQERGSTSYALIKADVVEWQPGQRTAGMEQQQQKRKQQLTQILDIKLSQARPTGTASISFEIV